MRQGVTNVRFPIIWWALFSCHTRFEIYFYVLLPVTFDNCEHLSQFKGLPSTGDSR